MPAADAAASARTVRRSRAAVPGPPRRSRTIASRSRARRSRAGAGLGQPGRDEPGRPDPVVPRDHPVVEAEHDVGDREVVVTRRRQALERRAAVVPDVPGGASLEWRQARDRRRGERREQLAHGEQRIARRCGRPRGRPGHRSPSSALAAHDHARGRRRGTSSGRGVGVGPCGAPVALSRNTSHGRSRNRATTSIGSRLAEVVDQRAARSSISARPRRGRAPGACDAA